MVQNEPDWKKELSSPPLQDRGFDDKLRRRIEEQLDRKEACRRKRFWLWPAMWTCSMVAVASAVWFAVPLFRSGPEEPSSASAAAPAGTAAAPASAAPPEAAASSAVKTGLLIGLREDYPASETTGPAAESRPSTYRTLMLAPVDGQVKVAAEGSGILVPYGQKFWMIESMTHRTDSDTIEYLQAHPADKPAEPLGFTDNPAEKVRYSEKLIFAGNQYVSVEEQGTIGTKTASSTIKQAWVRKLTQVTPSSAASFRGNTKGEEHVTVMDIFGEGALDVLRGMSRTDEKSPRLKTAPGDNWSIVRKPGRWTAQVADSYAEPRNAVQYHLQEYPADLPETVTAHDTVCCTWRQIRSMEPAAKDLLSSPLEDMVVILTDKELVVHSPPGHAEPSGAPLLKVALKPGETLVSAQWATGTYVPAWVEKTRKYLEQP